MENPQDGIRMNTGNWLNSILEIVELFLLLVAIAPLLCWRSLFYDVSVYFDSLINLIFIRKKLVIHINGLNSCCYLRPSHKKRTLFNFFGASWAFPILTSLTLCRSLQSTASIIASSQHYLRSSLSARRQLVAATRLNLFLDIYFVILHSDYMFLWLWIWTIFSSLFLNCHFFASIHLLYLFLFWTL